MMMDYGTTGLRDDDDDGLRDYRTTGLRDGWDGGTQGQLSSCSPVVP